MSEENKVDKRWVADTPLDKLYLDKYYKKKKVNSDWTAKSWSDTLHLQQTTTAQLLILCSPQEVLTALNAIINYC